MNVLYDSQIFSLQKFGGISRYFIELINHLDDGIRPLLDVNLSDNIYMKDHSISLPDFKGKQRMYLFYNRISDMRKIKKQSYSIFHPTYYNPYFLNRLKSPYIITVHDMIHERFSNLFKYEDHTSKDKRESITNANHIIAISERTKKDITEIYNIDASKIDVVYHGVTLYPPQKPKKTFGKYILFTGLRGGYKNFENLCHAFVTILKYEPDIKLVCTGHAFSTLEKELFRKLNIHNSVTQIFASESELAYLYMNASCFVFPSLYEGFGIPILEAFGYNCPLCLSDSSCFPEIAADAGAYFNPKDPESIAKTIILVLNDHKMREALIAKGQKRLQDFSWQRMAHRTSLIYQKLIE